MLNLFFLEKRHIDLFISSYLGFIAINEIHIDAQRSANCVPYISHDWVAQRLYRTAIQYKRMEAVSHCTPCCNTNHSHSMVLKDHKSWISRSLSEPCSPWSHARHPFLQMHDLCLPLSLKLSIFFFCLFIHLFIEYQSMCWNATCGYV